MADLEDKSVSDTAPVVLSIGHSTRTLEVFLQLLNLHTVRKIVDVRTVPRSRHNPQFNQETLPDVMRAAGIGYLHVAGLGGLRHPHHDSPNTGWHNSSFKGFADYMQTREFDDNLQKIVQLASRERIALMCAEAVPWRCHRSLIADALIVRGVCVEHILGQTHLQPHALIPWAQVCGCRIIYPPAQTLVQR